MQINESHGREILIVYLAFWVRLVIRSVEEKFMRATKYVIRAAGFFVALLFASHTAAITIFSGGGYVVPETISLAPGGFGGFGGSYFIPDASTNNIWVMPGTGGPPSLFPFTTIPTTGNNSIDGGVFLPSGWAGGNSVKYLVTAQFLLAFDSAGNQELFDPSGGAFSTPILAPAGFPTYGGDLFVSDQNNVIWRAPHAGGVMTQFNSQVSIRGDGTFFAPFGLEFTPPGAGSYANSLLVSDGGSSTAINGERTSQIFALSANGTPTLFSTVLLKDSPTGVEPQRGLRQMVMAPDNYFAFTLGIPGELLLVSVAGSSHGLGRLGDILAFDLDGNLRASLRDDLGLTKFDPRGMVFTTDGNLLISDTSPIDPIWIATANDFQRVPASAPVPTTLALIAIGLAGLCFSRRQRAS